MPAHLLALSLTINDLKTRHNALCHIVNCSYLVKTSAITIRFYRSLCAVCLRFQAFTAGKVSVFFLSQQKHFNISFWQTNSLACFLVILDKLKTCIYGFFSLPLQGFTAYFK